MPWTNQHIEWLNDTGDSITTSCGKTVPVFEFKYDMTNDAVMSKWAKHFRNHYCSDVDLPMLKPEGMTNSDYLLTLKFPNNSISPGPSIRAGDFSEILVADYLTYLQHYYVPRTRYDRKIIGNESPKGSDVIGFKQQNERPSRNDELTIFEVKAKLSENSASNVLQTAIDDSSKDEMRLAESLNGIRQRLFDRRDFNGMNVVGRFQKPIDEPYKKKFGAAAVVTASSYCEDTLAESDSTNHVATAKLEMLVIRGEHLMTLVHELYTRAAHEA